MINKNRLCSKTCGIDNIVKNSKEKNYSEILSELFIMSGNSSGLDLDPTPKRNHRAEVSGRIVGMGRFSVPNPEPRRNPRKSIEQRGETVAGGREWVKLYFYS